VTEPPTDTRPEAEALPAPPKRGRGRQTAGDMVRSLAVVVVLVGIIVAFNVAGQPEEVVRDVDYVSAATQARQQASYDVLAPSSLLPGWRATSARTRAVDGAVHWHLGLVTGAGDYAGVEQSDGERAGFVGDYADRARTAGTVTIAGASWRRLEGGEPEPRALVRTDGGVTTIVAGSATWSELRALAASLRP
jgi:hypothetical protein